MTDLMLILMVAAITFATRAAFLLSPRQSPSGFVGRFLDGFPLALFLAIATEGLIASGGSRAPIPALAAAAGGVLGGVAFRRSLLGVLALGAAAFYLVRALVG